MPFNIIVSPFPKTWWWWGGVSPYRERQGHAHEREPLDVGRRDRVARAHQFIAGVVLGGERTMVTGFQVILD